MSPDPWRRAIIRKCARPKGHRGQHGPPLADTGEGGTDQRQRKDICGATYTFKVPKSHRAARVGEQFVNHEAWDYHYPIGQETKTPIWATHRLYTTDEDLGDDTAVRTSEGILTQNNGFFPALDCFECDLSFVDGVPEDLVFTGRKLDTDMRVYIGRSPPQIGRRIPTGDGGGRLHPGIVTDLMSVVNLPKFPRERKLGNNWIPREFDETFELREKLQDELGARVFHGEDEEARTIERMRAEVLAEFERAKAKFDERGRAITELWSYCWRCGKKFPVSEVFHDCDPPQRYCLKCDTMVPVSEKHEC